MSDETYSLIAFLSALAAAASLWFRYKQRRGMRRLLKLLEEQRAVVAALIERAVEELEMAQRLLNAGGLREAKLAVAGAGRALTELRSHLPAAAALEEDVLALPDMITDTMLDDLVERARALRQS